MRHQQQIAQDQTQSGDRPDSATAQQDRRAAAVYLAELSGSLAQVARRHGLDAVGYLLEMAQLEARNSAGSTQDH